MEVLDFKSLIGPRRSE